MKQLTILSLVLAALATDVAAQGFGGGAGDFGSRRPPANTSGADQLARPFAADQWTRLPLRRGSDEIALSGSDYAYRFKSLGHVRHRLGITRDVSLALFGGPARALVDLDASAASMLLNVDASVRLAAHGYVLVDEHGFDSADSGTLEPFLLVASDSHALQIGSVTVQLASETTSRHEIDLRCEAVSEDLYIRRGRASIRGTLDLQVDCSLQDALGGAGGWVYVSRHLSLLRDRHEIEFDESGGAARLVREAAHYRALAATTMGGGFALRNLVDEQYAAEDVFLIEKD